MMVFKEHLALIGKILGMVSIPAVKICDKDLKVEEHLAPCPEKENQEVLFALPHYSSDSGRGLGDAADKKGTCVGHGKFF